MSRQYTLTRLRELQQEFLATLDNGSKDETYMTQRSLAAHETSAFFDWMEKRERQDEAKRG